MKVWLAVFTPVSPQSIIYGRQEFVVIAVNEERAWQLVEADRSSGWTYKPILMVQLHQARTVLVSKEQG